MPRAALREDVRGAILEVAQRLFAHYGYKKTTMEDLAREARIGKGTIYLYFKSKAEIALRISDLAYERVYEHLASIARSADSPASRIRRMLIGRVLYGFDNAAAYSGSLSDAFNEIHAEILDLRDKWLEKQAHLIAEVLSEGEALGTFASGDPLETACTLLRATNGLMPASLTPQERGNREEVRARVEQIVSLLFQGILRREDPPFVK
jgi:AcrR family transcriptional regulator